MRKKLFILLFTFGILFTGYSQIDTSSSICPKMKDFEGNSYSSTLINGQCWTTGPLRTKYDRDGNPLKIRSFRNLLDAQGNLKEDTYIDTATSFLISSYLLGDVNPDSFDTIAFDKSVCFEGFIDIIDGPDVDSNWFFYNWPAAMKVCPNGWHLPSKEEWISQVEYFCNNFRWDNAQGHKYYNNRPISGELYLGVLDGIFSFIWSSSERNENSAYFWHHDLYAEFTSSWIDDEGRIRVGPKGSAYMVRCVHDGEPCPAMKDYDGNSYSTVVIGSQCWTVENLRAKHDRNGKAIASGNDTSSVRPYLYTPLRNPDNVTKYGYLYNYPAAKAVCPDGWHLPDDKDWEQLTYYVANQCGEKIYKESNIFGDFWDRKYDSHIAKAIASKDGWGYIKLMDNAYGEDDANYVGNQPETNNTSGFRAYPAGGYINGIYKYFGNAASFWSSSRSPIEYDSITGKSYETSAPNAYAIFFNRGDIAKDRCDDSYGFSVRCVRN